MQMKSQVILKESVAKSRFIFRDEKSLAVSDLSQFTYRARLFDLYNLWLKVFTFHEDEKDIFEAAVHTYPSHWRIAWWLLLTLIFWVTYLLLLC